MATTNKRKMAEQKKKRVQNKIKKLEREDSLGISRIKPKFVIHPKVFITLKIISIILPLVCYFLFSYGLFYCMIFSTLLLIVTHYTEKYHNKSYIKSNHIKIPKFDSVVAILVMIVTIAGTLMGANTKVRIGFNEQKSEFVEKFESISSCLTGQRRMKISKDRFGNFEKPSFDMNFGMADLPENMPHMDFPPQGFGDFEPPKFDIDDLPLEALFSTVISTVNSVLIFAVPVSSSIVLIIYYLKRKKFDKDMNEVIADTYKELTEEDYYRIFTFDGVVEDESET